MFSLSTKKNASPLPPPLHSPFFSFQFLWTFILKRKKKNPKIYIESKCKQFFSFPLQQSAQRFTYRIKFSIIHIIFHKFFYFLKVIIHGNNKAPVFTSRRYPKQYLIAHSLKTKRSRLRTPIQQKGSSQINFKYPNKSPQQQNY